MLVLGMWGLSAQAQPKGGDPRFEPLAPGVYANPNGARREIDGFIARGAASLFNAADPSAQTRARKMLEDACFEKPATPASAAFLFEYSQAINAAFSPKVDPRAKAPLRDRLNVAIVTARVAAVGQNSALAPTVQKLIEDPTEPVVLWGLKAAQPLVPDVVKLLLAGNQKLHPMIAAIAPAVLKHPSGPIFDEAYTALGSVAGVVDPQPKSAHLAVMNELISLWENRLQQYRKDIAEDPAVDGKPVFFLTRATMWSTLIVDQKTRQQVMQMLSDQLGMAAQYADAIVNRNDQDKRDQLIKLVAQCCGGVYVVGGHQNQSKLAAESLAGSRLNPTILPWGTKVKQVVEPVIAEIASAYPGVKPPPTVGAAVGAARP